MVTRRMAIGLALTGGAFAAGASVVAVAYRRAIGQARARIAGGSSTVVQSRFGDLEYAEAGPASGPPFLMIHGTGGGFDQGLLFAGKLAGMGYRVIAPSRFGYLRSAMPPDPAPENQADAFVDLLDALAISRIAVAGGSAGALSALQFAIRHKDRCAALIPIVPASYAPDRPPARPWSVTQTVLAENILHSDFLFWTALAAAPDAVVETLLATDPALVAAASRGERQRVRDIMWSILPVSARAGGLLTDARLAGNPPPMALKDIAAPTLAISLEDDRYLTADAARHIAATVPGARLVVYPSGGHVWVGRDDELFAEVQRFLRDIGYG